MIKAAINGITFEFEDNISILDACRSIQLDIPTLCNDTPARLPLNLSKIPKLDTQTKRCA